MTSDHIFVNSNGHVVRINPRKGSFVNLNARYNRLAALSRKECESFGRGTLADNRAVIGGDVSTPYFFTYSKDKDS